MENQPNTPIPVPAASCGLATASLGVVWFAFAQRSGAGDAVVIDRDPAAGARLGGLLTACGVIFSVSVMGDWVSASATVADFVVTAAAFHVGRCRLPIP